MKRLGSDEEDGLRKILVSDEEDGLREEIGIRWIT